MSTVKVRQRKLFAGLVVALILLIGIVFLFDPTNTFSELVDGEYVIGEERYVVNVSASTSGVPENISAMFTEEDLLYRYVYIDANYKDEDGNSLEIDDLDYLEYSCGDSAVCELSNESDYLEELLGDNYWAINSESIDDSTSVEIPSSVTYGGVEYELAHYYVNYGNYLERDFCRPQIVLNNINYDTKAFLDGFYLWYFPDKIIPNDSLSDTVQFNWNYYEASVKLTNNVTGEGADLTKSFSYELWHDYSLPDGKYGDVTFSDGYGTFSLKNGESINLVIPGNYEFYLYHWNNGYIPTSDVSDSIYVDYFDDYEADYLLKEQSGNEIIYTYEFTPAKPLTITNTVVGGDDPNKEFGFTVSLGDKSINGVFSGVTFTNGVGRIHLKNGESKSLLFPNIETTYEVYSTNYYNYSWSDYRLAGNISEDTPAEANFTYTYKASGETQLEDVYSATVVRAEEMVPGRSYVVFRATGGVGYLLTGKGNAKQLTSYCSGNGCKVTWPDSGDAYSNVLWTYTGSLDKALLESFGAVNSYLTVGKSTSGKRPVSNEASYVKIETTTSPAMRVSNGGYYLALTSDKGKYTSSTSANSLYFAEIDENLYDISFDASNGGVHIYNGTLKKDYAVIAGDEVTAPVEANVMTPQKYGYKLESWIEINTGMEVEPGEVFVANANYEFYANWVPRSYDVGVNKDVVGNLDTSGFIETEVYDYSELYNLYSTRYEDNRWNLISQGNEVYFGDGITSRGIVFFDNAKNSKNGLLNSVDGRDIYNASRQVNTGKDYYDGIITTGINSNILDDLFDKESDLLGVNYVGSDSYLYQFDEETGFYYYDSKKNAASYNKSANRFYVYDYTFGTSKSHSEGENKTDFLPFNYMSKSDSENNKSISSSNGATNYWFGLKSKISFDLVDAPGFIDSTGNYGNKDVYGNDMILKFSGDDDVWVYVDDKLVLDLGGAHDIVYGEINFSTGVVTVAQNGASINYTAAGGFGYNPKEIADNSKITQTKLTDIEAGEHTVTFYYVERGASRSNVSLYFNIAEGYNDAGDLVVSRDELSYASEEKHAFTLRLSDTSITGKYGELEFTSGVALFKLSGGDKIKVSGLPAGISYSIEVQAPQSHTTKFTANGTVEEARIVYGRIVGGNTSTVDYINNYSEYTGDSDNVDSPNTGDSVSVFIIILIVSITAIVGGLIYLFVFSKKKKKNMSKEDDTVEVI